MLSFSKVICTHAAKRLWLWPVQAAALRIARTAACLAGSMRHKTPRQSSLLIHVARHVGLLLVISRHAHAYHFSVDIQ